ncbi:MAG: HEAT repeat domain-containing protein [Planctomycetota bacterium]|nr:HEAT repeat domain-containing protein [Planctomycetota bacterium]
MMAIPLGFLVVGIAIFAMADCAWGEDDPKVILSEFEKAWPDDRTPWRTAGDESWKAYALSMRRLVALGDRAVPALLDGLSSDRFQVRAFSARVLGFLGSEKAVPKLVALLDDKRPEVALLAADALGQIRTPDALKALEAAKAKHTKGDVLLHIGRALERQVALEEDVREQILKISSDNIGTAKVGAPAPDFALKDSAGKEWTLSSFKDKQMVVLVFNYGDG